MAAEASPQVPITRLCSLLGLSRSSHYRWRAQADRLPTSFQQGRQDLVLCLVLLFLAHRQRPGRRPMQRLLEEQGYRASLGRIDRIMRELGLQARRGRKRRLQPPSGPSAALTAHITNRCRTESGERDFTSTHPGVHTVGDMTQLPAAEGPLHVAVVIDLCTRLVLGVATSMVQDTALTSRALTIAREHHRLAPAATFHSDRGPQYTSHFFQAHCVALGVTQSMGTTGVCWDNAVAESFFASLKADFRSEFQRTAPVAEVQVWLDHWIDDWYNERRPHTTNGGETPRTVWNRLTSKLDPVPDS